MPRLLDSKTRYAHRGGSLLCIKEMAIRTELQKAFPRLPLQIENDGKCAALGEQKYAALKEVENGIMLVLETCVGDGVNSRIISVRCSVIYR